MSSSKETTPKTISRRDFLRSAGLLLGSAALSSCLPKGLKESSEEIERRFKIGTEIQQFVVPDKPLLSVLREHFIGKKSSWEKAEEGEYEIDKDDVAKIADCRRARKEKEGLTKGEALKEDTFCFLRHILEEVIPEKILYEHDIMGEYSRKYNRKLWYSSTLRSLEFMESIYPLLLERKIDVNSLGLDIPLSIAYYLKNSGLPLYSEVIFLVDYYSTSSVIEEISLEFRCACCDNDEESASIKISAEDLQNQFFGSRGFHYLPVNYEGVYNTFKDNVQAPVVKVKKTISWKTTEGAKSRAFGSYYMSPNEASLKLSYLLI